MQLCKMLIFYHMLYAGMTFTEGRYLPPLVIIILYEERDFMNRLTLFFSACSRLALMGIFWIAVRVSNDVVFHGLEHVKGKRPSYFAMAHKRDMDPLVEIPSILARQGWRAMADDVYFAMRSDAFSPGFLGRVVMYPRWFSRALRLLSLGSVLRFLGIRPLEDLHLRPAEMWIRDFIHAEGNMFAGDVLTRAFLQQLADTADEDANTLSRQRLSHLLSWRYQAALQEFYSVDILQQQKHWHTKSNILAQLKQELTDLRNWLARGGSIWAAPEGQLTPTGSSGRVTAILHRLLRTGTASTTTVPVAIIYDFMTAKRARIFVDVAPPILYDSRLPAQEISEQLRCAWLMSARFTCTQLASGFIVSASKAAVPTFTLSDLVTAIEQEAARLAETGRHVDQRLLDHQLARKRAASFMQYVEKRKLVNRVAHDLYEVANCDLTMEVRPGRTGYAEYPLTYAWNELQDMLRIEMPPEVEADKLPPAEHAA
jgi:hypothetical protein